MRIAVPAARASPFKGLAPYDETDAESFFGRTRETRVLAANLQASRLTLVYGANGSGKTSVVLAGVLPALRARAGGAGAPRSLTVFRDWHGKPLQGLSQAIERSLAGELDALPPHGDRLADVVRAAAEACGSVVGIILDQFEDYFLYHSYTDGDFARELADAIADPELPARFMFVLREDAFARLDRFKGRIPTLFDNYIRVDPLSRAAARDAIARAVDAYNEHRAGPDKGVEIEPEVIDAVVDETSTGVLNSSGEDRPVEAALLQMALSRLWDEASATGERTLRRDTLARLGGVRAIVETHVDRAMAVLSPDEQDVAAAALGYLITPSGMTIAHTPADLAAYTGYPVETIDDVLSRLARGEVRLLRPLPAADGAGSARFEVFAGALAPALLSWRAEHQPSFDRRRRLLDRILRR